MRKISKLTTFFKINLSIIFTIILNLISDILSFFKNNFKIFFSWLVLVTITLVFQNKIAIFLAENSFIKHDDVKEPSFNLAFIMLTIIFLIRFFWFAIKNYRLSQKHNYFIFFVGSIYYVLRNDHNDSLYFSYLSRRDNLYYSDLILLVVILSSLLLSRNMFLQNWKLYDNLIIWFEKLISKEDSKNSSYLIEDTPLNSAHINDNEKVIDEVVKAVINLKPSHSFIIGINSIWGIGKTSFLKRLEYKLKSEKINNECKPITFWFNAWQHQDEKSIINNFFNQLKKELSVFSGDSKNSIDNYLKEMFALVDNKYLNFFKSITDSIFSDGDTIKEFYDEINVLIEDINRKIIVFVDDIDRLNKNEILETLRILRNIADFKNVVFICGFDREYVVKQSQIDNQYLDKIFNLEISLTTQNQNKFILFLNELIRNSNGFTEENKNSLIESFSDVFYASENESDNYVKRILDKNKENNENEDERFDIDKLERFPLIPSFFFESRRDVKKFHNELYINIKTLKNIYDIDLKEYLILKLLLFKYKWMYKNFANRRMQYWLGNENVLKFKETDLKRLIINQELESLDSYIIFSVLVELFPSKGMHSNSQKINQKRYFPIYFGNNVFNECLSYTELLTSIKNNTAEELIIGIQNKDNEKLIKSDIKIFLLKEENINNVQEFMQVVNLIKKKYFDVLDELEINNFLYIGFLNFNKDYRKNLDSIFTDFHDSFGLYLTNLSAHYAKIPSPFLDKKDIEKFEMLDRNDVKNISLRIFSKEVLDGKTNLNQVLLYYHFFYEMYYTEFKRGFFYEDFKLILKRFITDNFEIIFFKFNAEQTMLNLDTNLLFSLFEDFEDRNKFIEILNNEITGISYDESEREIGIIYKENGLDNFIAYYEQMISSVSVDNLDAYKDFLFWLYTYKAGFYLKKPKIEEVKKFKKENLEKNKK